MRRRVRSKHEVSSVNPGPELAANRQRIGRETKSPLSFGAGLFRGKMVSLIVGSQF